jgi:RHS repeat-associated protein
VYDYTADLIYNYMRDYDPAVGRYVESDPIGLDGGLNTYAYVGGSPIEEFDVRGLAGSKSGGPWHPPLGIKTKCRPSDGCPQLRQRFGFLREWPTRISAGMHMFQRREVAAVTRRTSMTS